MDARPWQEQVEEKKKSIIKSVSSSACFCVSGPANVFTAGVTEICYRVLLSPEPTTLILILLSESLLSWSAGINTSSHLVSCRLFLVVALSGVCTSECVSSQASIFLSSRGNI